MKRILIASVAALALAAPASNAQAFLNKLKEKAESALSEGLSDKINEKLNGLGDKIADKTGIDLSSQEKSKGNDGMPEVITPEQQLQRRRISSFGWDGMVTPSTTKLPIPLMEEYPAIPSAEELANPTENGMVAFYNGIKRVALRAEELNADTTCEDEFALEWRRKQEEKLRNAFGLTKEEYDLLNSENISDAQREALEKKMMTAMFGDTDFEKMAADAQAQQKKYENMSEADAQSMFMLRSIDAMMTVYRADPAETKYVTGMAPAELEVALKAESQYQLEQERKGNRSGADGPEGKKMKEYEKMMTARDGAAYTKRSKDLAAKVQAAAMKAASSMEGGLGSSLMNMRKSMDSFESKLDMGKIQAAERKYMEACAPMAKAFEFNESKAIISSTAEKKKVESIKEKIYATSNQAEYNALYMQALEYIRTYRVRAASVWRNSLQKRIDNIKAQMPGYIKAQRDAVADGIIPECGLWRGPLNVVIELGDILEEAYSEFPCDFPHMYSSEVVRQITLTADEDIWWPEFYVSSGIGVVLDGRFLFKVVYSENGRQIYQMNAGKWNPVPKNFDEKKLADTNVPTSAKWKSADGKREVVYNADGHWIQLPEGDIVNPIAFEKQGDILVWAEENTILNEDGTKKVQIIKCTYKL